MAEAALSAVRLVERAITLVWQAVEEIQILGPIRLGGMQVLIPVAVAVAVHTTTQTIRVGTVVLVLWLSVIVLSLVLQTIATR